MDITKVQKSLAAKALYQPQHRFNDLYRYVRHREWLETARQDILKNPGRGLWVSQPTGMDISPDGRRAAVITYRSLYLFERTENERWPEAFQRAPLEIVGPPGAHDEAVGFSLDGRSVYVASEGVHSTLYRLDLP